MPRRTQSVMSPLMSEARDPGSMTPQIRAERVDDLPILLAYAKEMGVAEAIDRAILKAHGNRMSVKRIRSEGFEVMKPVGKARG